MLKALKAAWREFWHELKRQRHIRKVRHIPDSF